MTVGTLKLALHFKHIILDGFQILKTNLSRKLSDILMRVLLCLHCVTLGLWLLEVVLLRALLTARLVCGQVELRHGRHFKALAALVLLRVQLLSSGLVVFADAQAGELMVARERLALLGGAALVAGRASRMSGFNQTRHLCLLLIQLLEHLALRHVHTSPELAEHLRAALDELRDRLVGLLLAIQSLILRRHQLRTLITLRRLNARICRHLEQRIFGRAQ